jgi:hypothetical protein
MKIIVYQRLREMKGNHRKKLPTLPGQRQSECGSEHTLSFLYSQLIPHTEVSVSGGARGTMQRFS